MTKDWLEKVYEQVGADFMQAKIDSLLHEFRHLGAINENHVSADTADNTFPDKLGQSAADGRD